VGEGLKALRERGREPGARGEVRRGRERGGSETLTPQMI